MSWQKFRVIYELHSPLHIGYHKVGNVQRTRYYIPARNLWGSVTEALTRRGFSTHGVSSGDYQQVGEWVKTHCAFGYWFVYENSKLLTPCYCKDGLKYGNLSVSEFERRYLDSHVTTALDSKTNSAQHGSLHEVEFIAPYSRQNGARTRVSGLVFLDDKAKKILNWEYWLSNLQVGGERRYGFGTLRLVDMKLEGDPITCTRPCQSVSKNTSFLAHVSVTTKVQVQIRGQIEPLVGRVTSQSHAFGSSLTSAIFCWTPGSIPMDDVQVQFEQEGYWRVI
jgi:hypothetical protein